MASGGSGKVHVMFQQQNPPFVRSRKQARRFEQLILEAGVDDLWYRADAQATANGHHDCQALVKGWILA